MNGQAKVTISRGATVNLGNYESARIDLTVEATVDTLTEADTFLAHWLEDRVLEIQEEAGLPPHPVSRFTGARS